MAVTRSTAECARRGAGESCVAGAARLAHAGTLWLMLAALLVCGAWWLMYSAKVRRATTTTPLLNVSQLDRREQLLPVLQVFSNPGDRDFAARKIFDSLADHNGIVPNTGALARIRKYRAKIC